MVFFVPYCLFIFVFTHEILFPYSVSYCWYPDNGFGFHFFYFVFLLLIWWVCTNIEAFSLHQLRHRHLLEDDQKSGKKIRCNLWLRAALKSTPVLLLICTLRALPEARLYYLLGTLITATLFLTRKKWLLWLLPEACWITVRPKQKKELKKRLLKIIMVYLIVLMAAYLAWSLISMLIFAGTSDCSKSSSVKANMHTFQVLVETYAEKWQGRYPENAHILKQDANQNKGGHRPYWKVFSNPYTHQKGLDKSYTQFDSVTYHRKLIKPYLDILGIRFYLPWRPDLRGQIIYEYVHPGLYRIYGLDHYGDYIMSYGYGFTQSEPAPFTLCNRFHCGETF